MRSSPERRFNGSKQPLLAYLESCWVFCEKAAAKGIICALRLWNEGGANAENEKIEAFLHEKTEGRAWEELRFGSKKLAEKIYLENGLNFNDTIFVTFEMNKNGKVLFTDSQGNILTGDLTSFDVNQYKAL